MYVDIEKGGFEKYAGEKERGGGNKVQNRVYTAFF